MSVSLSLSLTYPLWLPFISGFLRSFTLSHLQSLSPIPPFAATCIVMMHSLTPSPPTLTSPSFPSSSLADPTLPSPLRSTSCSSTP